MSRLYPLIGVALAIALALAWVARLENRRAHWQETAIIWKNAFTAQKSSYEAAQEAAKVKALAKKKEEQEAYRQLAERTRDVEQEAAGLRAAADRFARSNRVRAGAKAAGGGSGRADRARQGDLAQSPDRPGADTDVVVPRHDFDVLVENTIRLKQANAWGEELLAAGLAVKVED